MEAVNDKLQVNIERICSISKALYSRYCLLRDIDYETIMTGNKKTKEKAKVIKELDMALEMEKSIFKEFDIDKYVEIENVMAKDLDGILLADNFDAILKYEEPVVVIRRLINMFSVAGLLKESIYKPNKNNPFFQDLSGFPNPYSKISITNSLETDTINRFIYYLNKEINSQNDPYIIKELVGAKYDIIYLSPIIFKKEDMLLDDKERLIIEAIPKEEQFKISLPIMISINYEYNLYRYKNCLGNLLGIDDKLHEEKDFHVASILTICLIKAILSGYDKKEIEELNKSFEFVFSKENYGSVIPNSNISKKMVTDAYEEVLKDKEKVIIKENKNGINIW